MKVTVAVPTYNRPRELARAIDSVLRQSFQPRHIVVGDDAASPDIQSICESFADSRIVYVPRRPILRMTENWDFVTRWADDGKVALLEDDNFWHPNHLASAVAAYQRFPNAVLFHSGHREAWDDGQSLTYYKEVQPPWRGSDGEAVIARTLDVVLDALAGGSINSSTVVIERSVLDRVRGFDCRYLMGMDTLMWTRLAFHGEIVYTGHTTTTYTYHSGNASRSEIQSRRAGAQVRASRRLVVKEALDSGALTTHDLARWLATVPPATAASVITAFAHHNAPTMLRALARDMWARRRDARSGSRYLRASTYLGFWVLSRSDQIDRALSAVQFGERRLRPSVHA